MRFKNGPQLPGVGITRSGRHHRSHRPTFPGTILLGKVAYHTKQICRQCTSLSSNMTWLKGPKVYQWPTLMLLLSVQDENQEAIGFRMDKGEMENGKIMDFRK